MVHDPHRVVRPRTPVQSETFQTQVRMRGKKRMSQKAMGAASASLNSSSVDLSHTLPSAPRAQCGMHTVD